MQEYCFGIDVGGTTVKMGLFRTDGELLEKWEIPSHTENEGAAILPDIAKAALGKLEERGIDKKDVAGIGIGVPGPIDANGVVPHTANLGWGYKEVTKELTELTGLPSKGGNDANVAALGEMWKGAAAGHKSGVMVTLGTGVGGGVIINGKIITGAHGAGGEIGHLCMNYEETEKCGCGTTGCLEQYASATGIVKLAEKRLKQDHVDSVLREKSVSAKAVFDALKAGDAVAAEIVEECGRYLGHGLANLAVVTDPSVIVIGGGVSNAGDILLDYVKKYFQEKAFFANKNTEFILATLGNSAGICGAAKLIL